MISKFKILNFFSLKKNFYILIILTGFFFSVLFSIYCINKFDKSISLKTGININGIIGSKDSSTYFKEAEYHIKNLKNNNLIKSEKPEYFSSWLHSKLLTIFFVTMSPKKKFNNQELKISDLDKLHFFIFQSLIFYLSLIYLFINIREVYDNRLALIVIIFLSFEPNIFQYHSSLLSESIFFSLNIIIFSFLINLKKNILKNFLIGILVGIAFLQRGIAYYYIFLIIPYYFLIFRKKFFKPTIFFLLGIFIILLILSFSNYLRTNNFFIKPMNSYIVIKRYFVIDLLYPEIFKISKDNAQKLYFKDNYNLNNFEKEIDKRNFLKKVHKEALKEVYKYKKESFLVFIKNSHKTLALDPLEVLYSYKYNISETINSSKIYKYFRIIYSFILYLFILVGFINFYKKNFSISFFIFFISSYFFVIAVIDGATVRILTPSLIYLSIFFGSGIKFLLYKNPINMKKLLNAAS